MSSNKQLELALEIATLAHKGATRRDDDPYIFHALRVANNKTYIRTKLQKAVAILHDVIEDISKVGETIMNTKSPKYRLA